jgi:hypothetical protein
MSLRAVHARRDVDERGETLRPDVLTALHASSVLTRVEVLHRGLRRFDLPACKLDEERRSIAIFLEDVRIGEQLVVLLLAGGGLLGRSVQLGAQTSGHLGRGALIARI